jgi:hypothetical protein
VALIWALPGWAWAQGPTASGRAAITAVDAANFPAMRVFLRVTDAEGRRVPSLPASAVQLAENTIPLAGVSVSPQQIGAQIVLALDPNDAFKARDVNGVNRLAYIQQALRAFAENTFTKDLDDVSIVTPDGGSAPHLTRPADLVTFLENYTSTFQGAADPFPLINQAVDLAAETVGRPGLPRYVIVFSNGLVGPNASTAAADVATRAGAAGIVIIPVYVGPEGSDNTVSAQTLRQLATLTGGEWRIFDRPPSLTPLWQTLDDAGWQFQLDYRSRLAATGQHTLAATLTLTDGLVLTTTPSIFPLRVEAPRLLAAEWPAVITRTLTNGALAPEVFEVPLTVDFPDGHPRLVNRVELRVDGTVLASATQPTDTRFTLVWPLTAYTSDGQHLVQLSATDELGFSAETAPFTLTLRVSNAALVNTLAPTLPPTPATPAPPTDNRFGGMALAVLGLALIVGGIVGGLWWTRRNRAPLRVHEDPEKPSARPSQPPTAPGGARVPKPVVKPIAPAEGALGSNLPPPSNPPPPTSPTVASPAPAPSPKRQTNPLRLPQVHLPQLHMPSFRREKPSLPKTAPRARALLEIVVPGRGQMSRAPIELFAETVKLGRDPGQAQVVFPDRSLAGLHARIELRGNDYFIIDENTVAGTWVNFEQIFPPDGYCLQHGDLINLGHVQLWFKRRDLSPSLTPTIKVE